MTVKHYLRGILTWKSLSQGLKYSIGYVTLPLPDLHVVQGCQLRLAVTRVHWLPSLYQRVHFYTSHTDRYRSATRQAAQQMSRSSHVTGHLYCSIWTREITKVITTLTQIQVDTKLSSVESHAVMSSKIWKCPAKAAVTFYQMPGKKLEKSGEAQMSFRTSLKYNWMCYYTTVCLNIETQVTVSNLKKKNFKHTRLSAQHETIFRPLFISGCSFTFPLAKSKSPTIFIAGLQNIIAVYSESSEVVLTSPRKIHEQLQNKVVK